MSVLYKKYSGPVQAPDHIVHADSDTQEIYHGLSVSDVERLAKAGVAIKFEDIWKQVHPDVETRQLFDNSLAKPLIERWAAPHQNDINRRLIFPFRAYVERYGDKFYVFIATQNGPPVVIEDAAHLYPSDALMASIHFLLEVQPKGDINGQGEQASQGVAGHAGQVGAYNGNNWVNTNPPQRLP